MTIAILSILVICSLFMLFEKRMIRLVLWFFLSSFASALVFLFLGSPDVAMAEAAAGAFSTIFFIVCYERFYGFKSTSKTAQEDYEAEIKENPFIKFIIPAVFVIVLAGLFLNFIPDAEYNPHLRDLFLLNAANDIGGENVVGAILLGYRMYDTVFEALLLVVAVVAVMHMSSFEPTKIKTGLKSEMTDSVIAKFLIRVISPATVLFGIYVIANGFLTAGGGFQGGLAIASFFICRFIIYDIYDMPIDKINKLEELVFIGLTVISALMIFHQGAVQVVPEQYMPLVRDIYLISMNAFIGLKVACGFIILFYRYVAIERNEV